MLREALNHGQIGTDLHQQDRQPLQRAIPGGLQDHLQGGVGLGRPRQVVENHDGRLAAPRQRQPGEQVAPGRRLGSERRLEIREWHPRGAKVTCDLDDLRRRGCVLDRCRVQVGEPCGLDQFGQQPVLAWLSASTNCEHAASFRRADLVEFCTPHGQLTVAPPELHRHLLQASWLMLPTVGAVLGGLGAGRERRRWSSCLSSAWVPGLAVGALVSEAVVDRLTQPPAAAV